MAKIEKIHIHFGLDSLLGIFSAVSLLKSIIFARNVFFVNFILTASLLAFDVFFIWKKSKNRTEVEKTDKYLDRFAWRSLSWLFITTLVMLIIITKAIVLNVGAEQYLIVETFDNAFIFVEIAAFFLGKNVLTLNWLTKNSGNNSHWALLKRFALFSAIYCLVAAIIVFIVRAVFAANIITFVCILFVIMATFFTVTTIRQSMHDQKMADKRLLATILIFFALFGGYKFLSRDVWLLQTYIDSVPYIYESNDIISYDDETGVYTIVSDSEDFKILQLTDIHLGGSSISYEKDLKALQAVYKLIEHTKPDLVIVTGDLTFPVGVISFTFNNTAPVKLFASFMEKTGIPWAFTYGNHDTESLASASSYELNELYKSLSWKSGHNLLYPSTQPEINGKKIWGRNNQLIEIRNSDGSLNQAVFLLDSNAYTGEGLNAYDYIHDDQVEWYKNEIQRLNEKENKTISSLGYFHMPLQQYKTAYDLYKSGSDEVKYYFGSNGEPNNLITASKHSSKLFDTAVELGSTKGFFCGHDHYNNASIEYKGIRLTYGMSIDYLVLFGIANKTEQRGSTLVTTHRDSSIDIEQIPLVSIE